MINNNRSESVAPVKGSEKVTDIRKELEELGSIKESLLSEISENKKLASDYVGIELKVEEKYQELKKVSEDVLHLNNTKVDLTNENKKLSHQKEEYDKVLSELSTIIKLRDNHKVSFENDKKKSDEILSHCNEAIKDAKEMLDSIEGEIKDLSEKRKVIQSYIKEEDETLINFKNQNSLERQHAKVLEKDIEAGKNLLKQLNTEYLNTKENNQTEAEKILSNAKQEAEKIMNDASDYKDKVDKAITEREGEVSNKEKFLKVREDFLKDIKSQLEDKLGKKIDNLVF